MSTTLPLQDPVQIRPLLHAEIDRMTDDDVVVLHRIALQLELESLSKKLDDDFDAARAAGKFDRLPGIIREARAAIRARAAS